MAKISRSYADIFMDEEYWLVNSNRSKVKDSKRTRITKINSSNISSSILETFLVFLKKNPFYKY